MTNLSKTIRIGVLVCVAYLMPMTTHSQERGVGEIIWMTSNYCPSGSTIVAAGQLLSVEQYEALFSLLTNTYGGDGKTTFGLPDLTGRYAVGQGQGNGLSDYHYGEKGGSVSYALKDEHIPEHSHALSDVTVVVNASSAAGNSSQPTGNYFANSGSTNLYTNTQSGSDSLSVKVSGDTGEYTPSAGSSGAYRVNSPYVVLTPCIVVNGTYPSSK